MNVLPQVRFLNSSDIYGDRIKLHSDSDSYDKSYSIIEYHTGYMIYVFKKKL